MSAFSIGTRSVVVVVAVLVGGAMTIAAACGFPDPLLVPNAPDSGDATAYVPPDAPPPVDATSEKPDVGPCNDPCDCDKDGFVTGDAATFAAFGCSDAGPLDCDDEDPRAKPDAGYRSDYVTLDTLGDWNCDGTVEREFENVGVKCEGIVCPVTEGFASDPGCGDQKTYVFCKSVAVVGCQQDRAEGRIQRCR